MTTTNRRAKRGSVWKRKRGGRVEWCAQYDAPRGEDGKRRRKTITRDSYGEVIAELKRRVGQADQGRVAEPGQLTVAELVDRFLTARGRTIEATTLAQYQHTLAKHVKPRLGGTKLAHLGPLHVESFLAAMDGDGVGTRARQSAFDLLSRTLAYGVKVDVLQTNPAQRVERPKAPRPEVRALAADQAKQLLAVARDTAPASVWAAVALALSGLRRGEVFGLTWGDVALERGEVRIRQVLKRTAKGKSYFGPPKTKAGRRAVPLPSWAFEAIRAHRAAIAAELLRAGSGQERLAGESLVFTNEDGGAVHFSNWTRRVWIGRDDAGVECGLRAKAGLPARATFHGLRHTAATLLLGNGVDVRTAQGVLGHARGSTTLDVYADYIPSNAARAMAQLDSLVSEAASS